MWIRGQAAVGEGPQPGRAFPLMSVTLERARERDEWRVLVHGQPIPMTVEKTASSTTAAGHSYDKVTAPPVATSSVPLDRVVASSEPWEVQVSEGHLVATCDYATTRVEVFNTIARTAYRLYLTLSPDLARVAVRWHEDFDSAT